MLLKSIRIYQFFKSGQQNKVIAPLQIVDALTMPQQWFEYDSQILIQSFMYQNRSHLLGYNESNIL